MAAVVKRTWCSRGPTGHKVRKVAWGYTLQVNGQQERRYDAAWSRRDAEEALAKRLLERDAPPPPAKSRTLGELTPSTVNRELAILRHMLRLAEEWGYITKVPKIRLSKEPEGRHRFLSEDEIERLLAACQDRRRKSPYLLSIVMIALNTGMRKGEILGLT